MNDRTRPPLDVATVLAEIDRANLEVIALCSGKRRWTMSVPAEPDRDSDLVIGGALHDARELLAAYQPTGVRPDDLAGLRRDAQTQMESFAEDSRDWWYHRGRLTAFDDALVRGVTLTGVRSSEASEGSEADSEAAARSSEVDGLREALDTIFRAFDKSGNVPMFLAATIRDVRALTGDTGPKADRLDDGVPFEPDEPFEDGWSREEAAADTGPMAEPEPNDYLDRVDHGEFATPEPSNGD